MKCGRTLFCAVVLATGLANCLPNAWGEEAPSGTVVWSGTVTWDKDWTFDADSSVTLTTDSSATVKITADSTIPATFVIGAGVSVEVSGNTKVVGPTADPVALTIKTGGKLKMCDQNAYVAHVLDLVIEVDSSTSTGGKLEFAESPKCTVSCVIARTYTIGGSAKAKGYYRASKEPTYGLVGNSAQGVYVCYRWTGAAGDGKWSSAGNWSGNAVPNYEYSAVTTATGSFVGVDLSAAAGQTITLDSDVSLQMLSYLPFDATQCITLAGAGRLKIQDAYKWGFIPVSFIARDAAVVLDVDFARPAVTTAAAVTGGGTLLANKGFYGLDTSSPSPKFALDGVISFGGKTDVDGDLNFWRLQAEGRSRVTFVDGADLTVGRILVCGWKGFVDPHGFTQKGGVVRADSVYVSPSVEWKTSSFAGPSYVMEAGKLEATNGIYLGTLPTGFSVHYPRGNFEMTGGTLRTACLASERNSNYYKLNGGTVVVGAGGLVVTEDTTGRTFVANTAPDFQLGAVTIAASDDWTADSRLSVQLSGGTVFDVAEHDVTLNGAVTGSGGLTKKGTGTLTVAGAYSASGAIRVEAGMLAFSAGSSFSGVSSVDARGGKLSVQGGVSAIPDRFVLSVDALSDVTLGSSVNLTVAKFVVGGEAKRPGTYEIGEGSITVSVPVEVSVWSGAEDGDWCASANWSSAGLPGETSVVDFFYSAVPSRIAVSSAATFKKVILPEGDLEISGVGVFTLPDGAEITVGDGATLTFDAPVYLKGEYKKYGKGKVVFGKIFRSETDPLTLTSSTGFGGRFQVVQGEAEVACPVEGLRLCAYSSLREDNPLLTISDGAVIVTNSLVHTVYDIQQLQTIGYGRIVQNGGKVDLKKGTDISKPYAMSIYGDGEWSYTLNGGQFSWPVGGDYQCFLNYNKFWQAQQNVGGTNTIVVNGGRLYMPVYLWTAPLKNSHNSIRLTGGLLNVYHLRHETGWLDLNLSGGTFVQQTWGTITGIPAKPGNWTENLSRVSMTIGGDVAMKQDYSDAYCRVRCSVSGSGKITQQGSAILAFDNATGYSGDYSVESGKLEVGANTLPPASDAKLTVATGAKVVLNYDGVANIGSVEIAGKLRRAGQYSASSDPHGGRFAGYFEGGGVLNALTGAAIPGFMLFFR